MDIILHMQPTKPPITWQDFLDNYSDYSIAIDGFVADAPKYEPLSHKINFNHHENVSRLETRATASQALLAIRMGLYEAFTEAHVYANDCDEDVCLTWFILKNPNISSCVLNPILNRLAHIEDMLDTTAGAYPFPTTLKSVQESAWIFEPYRMFRTNGGLDRKVADEYVEVVDEVCRRIQLHLDGKGELLEYSTEYNVIAKFDDWVMIEEIGPEARKAVFADGIKAFVSVRKKKDGYWCYSVGRQSIFVPFDVPTILKCLDINEENYTEHWGGSDTIGGSPRVCGSKLSPEEVCKIIEEKICQK